MLVELDIFSGRPNPRWPLDEPTARRLRGLHAGLDATTVSPPESPGLGYRGFLYTLGGVTWRACLGFVVGPARVLADPARSVERLLCGSLPPECANLRSRIFP